MIRAAHSADWHVDPQNFDQTLPAIRHFIAGVVERKPDLIVVTGDLFVKRGYIDPTAGFEVRSAIQQLGEVAPVVIIPGNHDEQNAFEAKDSVEGALAMTETRKGLFILTRPCRQVIGLENGETIQVFALPTPNKYYYLSQTNGAEDVKEAISRKLGDVVRGFIAELDPELPSILLYHGSVVGGQGDSEMLMTTGIDIALDRGVVGDAFDAIAAGHLHRPQEVGCFVYSGAPAPLTFGMESVKPSWCLWTIDPDPQHNFETTFERIPIPVAHQLITLTLTEDGIAENLGSLKEDEMKGARIRVMGKVHEHLWSSEKEDGWEEALIKLGAASVRFSVERIRPASIRMEDATAERDIQSLLKQWLAVNPEAQSLESDLLTLSEEVEGMIPVSDRLSTAGSDYRPRRVWWKNFKQYREGEIDFRQLNRLVCITGPNFSGKSNAAEAEAFALYKYLRGSSKIEDIVRNGERACEVGVEFTAQGELWRIIRTVKRLSGGAAAGDVRLERNMLEYEGDDRWLPQNAGTAPETEKKIQGIVGSPALYFATRYRSQFDIDRLLNMRPSELKDTLQLAVNTKVFDLRSEAAKTIQRKTEQGQASLQAKMEQLDRQITRKESLALELATANQRKGEDEQTIEGLKETSLDYEKEIQAKRTETQRLSALREERAKAETRFKRLSDDIEAAQAKIDSLEKTIHGSATIADQITATRKLENLTSEMQGTKDRHDELMREIDSLERKIADERQAKQQQVEKLEYQLRIDEKTAELIDKAFCGAKDEYAACALITNSVQARDNIPAIQAALEETRASLSSIGESELEKLLELGRAREAVGYKPSDHRQLLKNFQALKDGRWEEKSAALFRAQGELEAARSEMSRLIAALEDARADRDAHADDPLGLAVIEGELGDLLLTKKETDEAIERARRSLLTIVSLIGSIQGALKMIEDAEKERAALHAAAERGDRLLQTLTVYLRAVSRDGLPFLILESKLRALQDYANRFIGDAPIRLEIEPMAGDRKDSVIIRFSDEKGTHPISETSGFQKMMTGVPLSAALAMVAAEANGGHPYHFFIDEGFGAYRKENFQYGKQLLQKLADEFERVIFVADVPEIELIAETTLRVVPEPDGNRIEVVNG